jgi:hypothetical protein
MYPTACCVPGSMPSALCVSLLILIITSQGKYFHHQMETPRENNVVSTFCAGKLNPGLFSKPCQAPSRNGGVLRYRNGKWTQETETERLVCCRFCFCFVLFFICQIWFQLTSNTQRWILPYGDKSESSCFFWSWVETQDVQNTKNMPQHKRYAPNRLIKGILSWVPVAHTGNPSNSGSRDQKKQFEASPGK